MIKGLAKDEMTLKKLGITKGSKVMVIGSSLNDVLQVSTTPKDATKDLSSTKDKDTSSSRLVFKILPICWGKILKMLNNLNWTQPLNLSKSSF